MKTILLTGASGGIGISIAETLVKKGYFVVGVYNKNVETLNALAEKLNKEGYGGYLSYFSADFSDVKSVNSAFSQIEKSFKHFDAVINNVGIDLYKTLTDTTEKEWDNIFDVNVRSAFLCSKFALKSMIERKQGAIVNVSSVWGKVGGSMEVAYSASKSALIGFTKALSKEVAESGIRVNCICPGVIDTKMNARFDKAEMQELIEKTPLKRIGKPQEIAETIAFLIGENSQFITGEIITVDGGFSG